MAEERRLGDVPGIDDIVPIAATLPYEDVSILEVNGVGEITAGEIGLGDLATPYYSDPFAIRPDTGAAQDKAPGGQQGSGGPSPSPAPSSSASAPSSGGSYTSSGTVAGFDDEQLANAQIIAETGESLGASERDIQIALMTAIVESGLRNLDYGDRDSIGLFQQRDAWGSREDRLDPAKSAAMFFQGGAAGQQGLFDIEDRDSRPMGEVAQDVQVSAFPERYAEHEAEAQAIMARLSGETYSGSIAGHDPHELTQIDGKELDYLTAAALDAAKQEFGGEFSLMQGHNPGGVAASGGTHDGQGVVDLSVPNGDWAGAMTALRKIGFAAWVRNVPGYGQAGSGAHIHAVLIDHEGLSPEAQTQVQSYLNNDDGLAGSRADDGPRDFVNNRFTWADAKAGAEPDDPFDVEADGDVVVGGALADTARTYLGVPFKWGGESFGGVDAAGLVRKVYENQGISLPKDMISFIDGAESIEVEKAKPGDLISWGQGQVGILGADGYIIEANRPGAVVQLSALDEIKDAFAIPYRVLSQAPQATPAYRPPAITRPAYSTPAYSVGASAPAASPGISHGGDIAPKTGMNSGGSKPQPSPTTTKKPLEGFI